MTPSAPSPSRVLADLADFAVGFLDAVEGAKVDYRDFQNWRPGWFPSFTGRFTANFLHERIWDRWARGLHELEDAHVVDHEPVREVRVGTRYVVRVKRHRIGDRIASYPTVAALQFWANGVETLEGLETYSLAFGYYWDPELRQIGEAVVSFRDALDKPVWAVVLRRQAGSAAGVTWAPTDPDLPELDLSAVLDDEAEDDAS